MFSETTNKMLGKKLVETLRPSVRNSNFPSNHKVHQVIKPITKPVILIIHGAWFTPEIWQPFIQMLAEAGFEAHCPRLPTCGDKENPTGTFADCRPARATFDDDVKVVRKKAIEIAATECPIIVLAHSYGGAVAADAIDGELCAHIRPPGTGGIIKLLLLSAWLPLKGSSVLDCWQSHDMISDIDIGFNEDGTVVVKNAAEIFFNDVRPFIRADELAAAMVTFNWSASSHKLQSAPWEKVPTTYIHCRQDKGMLQELQESMVRDAVLLGGAKGLKTETLDSGHCPFLSMPGELLGMIEKIAASV